MPEFWRFIWVRATGWNEDVFRESIAETSNLGSKLLLILLLSLTKVRSIFSDCKAIQSKLKFTLDLNIFLIDIINFITDLVVIRDGLVIAKSTSPPS